MGQQYGIIWSLHEYVHLQSTRNPGIIQGSHPVFVCGRIHCHCQPSQPRGSGAATWHPALDRGLLLGLQRAVEVTAPSGDGDLEYAQRNRGWRTRTIENHP